MEYGYSVREFTMHGDEPERLVEIDLDDGERAGKVVMLKSTHEMIKGRVVAAEDYRRAVMSQKAKAKKEWLETEGPDSELGRNMEAGTPSTDHSSE